MSSSPQIGPNFDCFKSGAAKSMFNASIVDIITPDMLGLIDVHWYQYPQLEKWWYALIGSYMFVVGLMSGIGNGLVCYAFVTASNLRTPSNLLVVNLAFADFCMVFYMTPIMVYNSINGTWSFGPFACSMYGMIGSIFGVTSIWTMVVIALDRYNVIVRGVAAKKWTFSMVGRILVCIWIHSLLWTIAPILGWNKYVLEGNMTSCGTDYFSKDWTSRSYLLIYSVFAYFIPLFTIIWAYYHVTHAVFEHERLMREQAKKMNVASLRNEEGDGQRQEIKIAKVSIMVVTLWFFAWTPYLIINYAGMFDLLPLSPLGTLAGAVCTKTSAIFNAVVYGISHPKFRAVLNEKVPCLRPSTSASDNASHKTADTTN